MPSPERLDRRALTWGAIAVAIVVALTFIGSDRLVWFDAALVGYLFGVVFAVFGIVYRYAVWLRRPPTRMLNQRADPRCSTARIPVLPVGGRAAAPTSSLLLSSSSSCRPEASRERWDAKRDGGWRRQRVPSLIRCACSRA